MYMGHSMPNQHKKNGRPLQISTKLDLQVVPLDLYKILALEVVWLLFYSTPKLDFLCIFAVPDFI